MRIVFIGQAAFGKDALDALVNQGETVVGVITVPDRNGRENPVKSSAQQLDIPVLQPSRLKDLEALDWVRALKPALLVLAYVTQFVPKEMIEICSLGGINYHPSLLPKYRGGSAMNWAIINGETETGVTIHQIDEGVDTGPIIIQEKTAIDPDDTLKSLYFQKLYPLGIRMVAQAVQLIREGKTKPITQNHALASFQPVIRKPDVVIDWANPSAKIYNLIRGSNPAPGAWSRFKDQTLTVWEANPCEGEGNPGEIIDIDDDTGFVIATADGAIRVQRVQLENSGKMAASEFTRKYGLKKGDRLDLPA